MESKQKIKVLILAAGRGTRMKSELPKALVKVGGQPMLSSVLKAVESSGVDGRPVIIVGYEKEKIMNELGEKYDYVVQEEQLGTGHAVASAQEFLKGRADHLIVLPSDHPFVSGRMISKLAEKHLESKSKITLATIKLPDFKDWRKAFYSSFSRIVRNTNGEIVKDVQFKDASDEEKQITEVNPIYFCFETKWLWDKIETLKNDNSQKEYYLTDLISLAMKEGAKVESINIEPLEGLAANSNEELQVLESMSVQRI